MSWLCLKANCYAVGSVDRKGRFPIANQFWAFLRSRRSDFSIPFFAIEQFDPRIPSKKSTFSTGCVHRIARSKKCLKAHRISHHPTKHTITPYNSSGAGLAATILLLLLLFPMLLLLLLLTTTRRGTSCCPPASSAYRHPMAAKRVIDDFFATPLLLLLLLCSLWRLSTKSDATTATMKRIRTPPAPNERFDRGKGATKTCLNLNTASSSMRTP